MAEILARASTFVDTLSAVQPTSTAPSVVAAGVQSGVDSGDLPVLFAQATPRGVPAITPAASAAQPAMQKGVVIEGKDGKLPISVGEISTVEVLDTDLLIRSAKGELFVLPDGALKALSQPNAQVHTQSGDVSLSDLYRKVGQFKAIESGSYRLGIESSTVKPTQPDPVAGNSLQIGAEQKSEAEQIQQVTQSLEKIAQTVQSAQLSTQTTTGQGDGLGPGKGVGTGSAATEAAMTTAGATPRPKVVDTSPANDNTSKQPVAATDDSQGVGRVVHNAMAKITNVAVSHVAGVSDTAFSEVKAVQTTASAPLAVTLETNATVATPQWGNRDTTVLADLALSQVTGTLRAVLSLAPDNLVPSVDLLIDGKSLASGAITLTADANGVVRAPMTWTVAEDGAVIKEQVFQVKVEYYSSVGLVKQSIITFSYDDVKTTNQIAQLDKFGFQILKLSAFGLSYDVTGSDITSDTMNAGNGDDIVRGLGGNDTISGGRGNDTLYGGEGSDTLNGDTGNDKLYGGAGVDVLDGGKGNDLLVGGKGADAMVGGEGTDTASYADSASGVTVFLEATRQVENVGGDAQDDTLATIENLIGSASDDRLTGDDAVNVLQGGDGSDTLEGRGGADVLDGGTDTNTSYTNTASYSLSDASVLASLAFPTNNKGDALGDTYINIQNLTGSRFGDTLEGDAGINILHGGGGADTIKGGAGRDQLFGDGGDDLLIGGTEGDAMDGGTEIDTASYQDSVAAVTASLLDSTLNTNDAAKDTYAFVENLTGTNYDDTLSGDGNANVLDGGAGNDLLEGGTGADLLIGGNGLDTATYAHASGPVSANLFTPSVNTGEAQGDKYDSIENLTGSDFADTLTGNNLTNRLDGGKGNDTLVGGGGGDFYIGGESSDTADYTASSIAVQAFLTGSEQGSNAGGASGDTYTEIENLTGTALADTLVGDINANILKGGNGADTLDGGRGTVGDVLDGGLGTDTVDYFKAESGVTLNLDTGGTAGDATGDSYTSIENVKGTKFADLIEGNSNDNAIYGNDGNDTIVGGGGIDTLSGGAGDDLFKNTGSGKHVYYGGDSGGDSGVDTVSYEGFGSAVTASLLSNGANSTGAGGIEEYYGIENLQGGNMNDKLTGDGRVNRLEGGAGDDSLSGGAGNDILLGGTNNDILDGGEGSDILNGESGTDTVTYKSSAVGVLIDLANVTVGAGSGTGDAHGDTFTSIEIVTGSYYADTFIASSDAILFNGGDEEITLTGGIKDKIITLDEVDYSASISGVTVDLLVNIAGGPGATGGLASGDTFMDIDNVKGSLMAANTLSGNDLANQLTGGDLNDTVSGGKGNDILNGGKGDDTLNGGEDDDTLNGGVGDDTLTGGAGIDTLDGGANTQFGGDTVSYEYKTDVGVTVALGLGGVNSENDVITNVENLIGTIKADVLTGDGNVNVLTGGEGNDTLSGLAGDDSLLGGVGDDILIGGIGRDVLNGGPAAGSDTASYVNAATLGGSVGLVISLESSNTNTGEATGDTYIQIDNLIGSAFDDKIYGNAFDNKLDGGEGDDFLVGGAGADTFDGGGNTTVTATSGGDTVSYISSTDTAGLTIDDSGGGSGDASGDRFINIEKIEASNYDDIFTLSSLPTMLLDGGLGLNKVDFTNASGPISTDLTSVALYKNIQNITGSSYDDSLVGDQFNNVLKGGLGNDILEGRGGLSDTLDGGPESGGSNTASYEHAPVLMVLGVPQGIIASLANFSLNTGEAAGDIYINIQNLLGGAFSDILTGDGNNNILTGAGGTNTLSGGAGNDTFVGGAGVDTFNGDGDTDTVTYAASGLGVTVDLSRPVGVGNLSTNDALGDVYGADVENFIGTNSGDIFYGRATAENINAGGGNDIIYGSSGADTLSGGGGTDTINYTLSGSTVTVNMGDGLAESGGDAQGDILNGFKILVGSNLIASGDTLTADNSGLTIYGMAGDDTIKGGNGADFLYAGSGSATGADHLDGGDGADRLDFISGNGDGNLKNDVAYGGMGDDTIAIRYSDWQGGISGMVLDGDMQTGVSAGIDTLEVQMSGTSTLDLAAFTNNAGQYQHFETFDLSKDTAKTTVQLSWGAVQNLVDQGAGSILTLKLGTNAGDLYQIVNGVGETASQSVNAQGNNVITFFNSSALQQAQVVVQYV